VNAIGTLARAPRAAFDFANVILTIPDASIGQTPREVVWTHRGTTLYRYRSSRREHPIPVLLVFALINRPEIFDLRPGFSLVEFLLDEGFDVFDRISRRSFASSVFVEVHQRLKHAQNRGERRRE